MQSPLDGSPAIFTHENAIASLTSIDILSGVSNLLIPRRRFPRTFCGEAPRTESVDRIPRFERRGSLAWKGFARSGRWLIVGGVVTALVMSSPAGGTPARAASTNGSAAWVCAESENDRSLRQALRAVSKRLLAAREVAAYKEIHHLPISDPDREKVVIEAAVKKAEELGADPELVRQVVVDQIEASKIAQKGYQELWSTHPELRPENPSLDHAREEISQSTALLVESLVHLKGGEAQQHDVQDLVEKLKNQGLPSSPSDHAAGRALSTI